MMGYRDDIVTMGLSRTQGRYRFRDEINGDFSRKSQNFHTPVYFESLLTGFPLESGFGERSQKKN